MFAYNSNADTAPDNGQYWISVSLIVCACAREKELKYISTCRYMHLLFKYTVTVAAPDTAGVMDPFSVCVCVCVRVCVHVCACVCACVYARKN